MAKTQTKKKAKAKAPKKARPAKPSKTPAKNAPRVAPKSSKAPPPPAKPMSGKPPPGKPVPGKPGAPAPIASRAPVRAPERAEELKQKLGALASSINQIKALKRTLGKSFYDIGEILRDVRDRKLYEAKGYGSFESFVEREIELGKQLSLRLVRIVQVFLREAALASGVDRLAAALGALDGETEGQPTSAGSTASPQPTLPGRAGLPPHKV